MSWTAPKTWATNDLITAALLNAHVRDNLLETAPAKVTTAGDTVYATGANAIARLAIGTRGALLKVNSGATAPQWLTVGTAKQVLASNGTDPAWASIDPSYLTTTRVYWTGGVLLAAAVSTSFQSIAGSTTEQVDTDSINSSGTVTFTAGTAGTYMVLASSVATMATTPCTASIRIAKSGSDIDNTQRDVGLDGSAEKYGLTTFCIATFADADTLNVQGKSSANNGAGFSSTSLLLIRIA